MDRLTGRSNEKELPFPFTVGITTFVHRFDRYFMPLLNRLREFDRQTEIIVAVNGEHDTAFDEQYRSRILAFLSGQPGVFPVFFPRFRGLSKLWNTIMIHATHDHVLMLNDDIMISSSKILGEVGKLIGKNKGRSFIINRSWSHFVLCREEIDQLGYFDERLLGIGEEDGDMSWRYQHEYGRAMADYKIRGIENYAEETVRTFQPANIQCHSGTKYSLFNRDFINCKYRPDPAGIKGMFEQEMRLEDPCPQQYPNERFYRSHKSEL